MADGNQMDEALQKIADLEAEVKSLKQSAERAAEEQLEQSILVQNQLRSAERAAEELRAQREESIREQNFLIGQLEQLAPVVSTTQGKAMKELESSQLDHSRVKLWIRSLLKLIINIKKLLTHSFLFLPHTISPRSGVAYPLSVLKVGHSSRKS